MTKDLYPAEPAGPGELLSLGRALQALQAEGNNRVQNAADLKAHSALIDAIRENRAAMTRSTPATEEDFLVLIAHALENLAVTTAAYMGNEKPVTMGAWFLEMEQILLNLKGGIEARSGLSTETLFQPALYDGIYSLVESLDPRSSAERGAA